MGRGKKSRLTPEEPCPQKGPSPQMLPLSCMSAPATPSAKGPLAPHIGIIWGPLKPLMARFEVAWVVSGQQDFFYKLPGCPNTEDIPPVSAKSS